MSPDRADMGSPALPLPAAASHPARMDSASAAGACEDCGPKEVPATPLDVRAREALHITLAALLPHSVMENNTRGLLDQGRTGVGAKAFQLRTKQSSPGQRCLQPPFLKRVKILRSTLPNFRSFSDGSALQLPLILLPCPPVSVVPPAHAQPASPSARWASCPWLQAGPVAGSPSAESPALSWGAAPPFW